MNCEVHPRAYGSHLESHSPKNGTKETVVLGASPAPSPDNEFLVQVSGFQGFYDVLGIVEIQILKRTRLHLVLLQTPKVLQTIVGGYVLCRWTRSRWEADPLKVVLNLGRSILDSTEGHDGPHDSSRQREYTTITMSLLSQEACWTRLDGDSIPTAGLAAS
jgi:hypothetical protein